MKHLNKLSPENPKAGAVKWANVKVKVSTFQYPSGGHSTYIHLLFIIYYLLFILLLFILLLLLLLYLLALVCFYFGSENLQIRILMYKKNL